MFYLDSSDAYMFLVKLVSHYTTILTMLYNCFIPNTATDCARACEEQPVIIKCYLKHMM
ncbi:hypothetical protein ACJX0J_027885, partial [Zea mays]